MNSIRAGLGTGCMLLFVMGLGHAAVLEPVGVRDVTVGGEIGRRIEVTVTNNLLKCDLEGDFLRPFQEKKAPDGYVGLGKTLDAMARLAAHTGNAELLARHRKTVAGLLATQEPDGYMGIMKPEARVGKLWDVHEMAYLLLGLCTDYEYFGEESSLEGVKRLAEYLRGALMRAPRPVLGGGELGPNMPDTGLEEALLALAERTGDAAWHDFARDYRPLPDWHPPLVLGRWNGVEGHAYAYVDKCLAQLRLDRSEPMPTLTEASEEVMHFLLRGDGLVAPGTCGDHECWHDTQSGTTNLGETCTTAYLIRFWDELLRRTGEAGFGDLIERAVYNALFAAQSPDGRRIRYYSPFETTRVYFEKDTYCCPCNYRRIVSELPAMIAYRTADGAAVSLYTPSAARLTLQDGATLRLVQETDYPASGKVALRVELEKAASFTLRLRVPRWCGGAEWRVNGTPAEGAVEKGFMVLTREWKPGDTVEAEFAMPWRLLRGRKTQDGRAAVLRGPLLFAFNPARNPGLEKAEARLLTLDTASIEGPFPDDSLHPGGLLCTVRVWEPGAWYPHAGTVEAVLTEFADPGAEHLYFTVPNPNDPALVDDEFAVGLEECLSIN